MEKTVNTSEIVIPLLYFGSVHYYISILSAQKVYIEAHENFSKQTLRNRAQILSSNGKLDLIVPVKNKNSKAGIKNMDINHEENWAWQHMHGLLSAYRKSPYFEFYQPDLEAFFQKTETWNLWQINSEAFKLVASWLKLNIQLTETTEFVKDYPNKLDLRWNFKPAKFKSNFSISPYIQVFSDRFDFQPNCSILDLVFNLGPESTTYLKSHIQNIPINE